MHQQRCALWYSVLCLTVGVADDCPRSRQPLACGLKIFRDSLEIPEVVYG